MEILKPLWAEGAAYFVAGELVELPGGRMDHDDILDWLEEQRVNTITTVPYEDYSTCEDETQGLTDLLDRYYHD